MRAQVDSYRTSPTEEAASGLYQKIDGIATDLQQAGQEAISAEILLMTEAFSSVEQALADRQTSIDAVSTAIETLRGSAATVVASAKTANAVAEEARKAASQDRLARLEQNNAAQSLLNASLKTRRAEALYSGNPSAETERPRQKRTEGDVPVGDQTEADGERHES